MAATNIYYWDWENINRRRFRVEVFAGDASTLAPVDVPAWGAEPADTSNYVRIPSDAFAIVSASPTDPGEAWDGGEAGFADSRPWGMAETTTYKLEVDLGGLGSTVALQYLRSVIISPRATNAGTINPGATYERTFDTSTLFRVLHDGFDADLAVTSFATSFIGVRRVLPSAKYKIYPGRTATIEIELFELGRAVLDSVRMSDVAARCVNSTVTFDGSTSPDKGAGDNGWDKLYDTRYTVSGRVYSTRYQPASGSSISPRVWMYSVAHLFDALEKCCEDACASYLRETPAYSGGDQHFALSALGVGGRAGTPWDAWRFYGQLTDGDTGTGSVLSASSQEFFPGTMHVYSVADGISEPLGGLLGPTDNPEIAAAFPTGWDFVSAATNAAIVKGKVRYVSGVTYLDWRPCRGSQYGSANALTLADIMQTGGGADEPEAIEVDQGGTAMPGVDVALQETFGEDVAEYTETAVTDADGGGTIKMLFDTNPLVGPPLDDSQNWLLSSLPGETFGFRYRQWPMWKLFYKTGGLWLRVHHYALLDIGAANNAVSRPILVKGTSPTAWPSPSGGDSRDDFLKPWREVAILCSQLASWPQYCASVALSLFGPDRTPTLYSTQVSAAVATGGGSIADRIGDPFAVTGGANALLATGDTYLSPLESATCYLTKVTVDDATDLAQVELLGLEAP